MPYTPPPDLDSASLAEIAALVRDRKLPPVASWNPKSAGDSDMRIAADGRWYHQDGEITRPAMLRAFSSLLRKDDDGSHWLVTPQYKLSIIVEETAFIAVEMTQSMDGSGQVLAFRLNSDDVIIAGPDNPIAIQNLNGTHHPYLYIREGLWAKLARSVFYELAEIALQNNPDAPSVFSNGEQFSLAEML